MVLLKLIFDLQRLHQWKLHVWHGDHSWHNESGYIAKELKDWCHKRNLNFFSDCTTQERTKSEARARDWRYKQLASTAKALSSKDHDPPCYHVLTGHTATDRAETLLLNLARGADLKGITSLKESRILNGEIHLVRPLLGFSRDETDLICKEMKLPVWIDPSNKNTNFSRNRVRQQIIPVLEELHPGCSMRMASLAERLCHYEQDQQAMANLLLEVLENPEGLCRQTLSKMPVSARTTLLANWLKRKGAPGLSALQLEELSIKTGKQKPPGCIHLAKGWKISWERGSIHLEHPNASSETKN